MTSTGKTLILCVLGCLFVPGAQAIADTSRREQIRLDAVLSGAKQNRAEICGGDALNQLVEIIRQRGLTVSSYALQPVEIAHVQLRRGRRGVAFRCNGIG
jgi:hypothetical protein